MEAKNKLAHDDRKSGPGDDGSQDDALHDEFFRQGERVDKEHIAAREAAVNAQPPEAMARPHPAAKRQDPRLAERRRNLRRVVGYVLAPAIVIALIAGAKVLNSTSEASPRPASPPPPALSDTHPSTAASSQHAASDTTAPAPHAPMAADSTAALTDTDSAPVAPAAASNEEAAPATQNVNAAAPPAAAYAADAPAFPDGVDPRKAASLALNRGKWNEALTAARAALAKEPTDATLYLYEGTALQEQGRKQEAKEVFRRCVDNAKKGPVNECRVFAR